MLKKELEVIKQLKQPRSGVLKSFMDEKGSPIEDLVVGNLSGPLFNQAENCARVIYAVVSLHPVGKPFHEVSTDKNLVILHISHITHFRQTEPEGGQHPDHSYLRFTHSNRWIFGEAEVAFVRDNPVWDPPAHGDDYKLRLQTDGAPTNWQHRPFTDLAHFFTTARWVRTRI